MDPNAHPDGWLGRTARRTIRVTPEMHDQFTTLSGDTSAIHVNAAAARERGFRDRVVHGMHLAALVSAVIGTELPGDDGVLQQVQLSFRAPCHPGDEVDIEVAVEEFYESVQTIVMKVTIRNLEGVVLASGKAQSGIRSRRAPGAEGG
jgi:3-hydroxybutyryl-CoA dehydratase